MCGGALETGAIHLRGDQCSICIIRMKRENVVHAEFHNLFEGVVAVVEYVGQDWMGSSVG